MTRDEAALILHPDTTISALEKWDNSNYETRIALVEEACRMGAEVLRHRQPDAETGLVPCGCGGIAEVEAYPPDGDDGYLYDVSCPVCGTYTTLMKSADGARKTWNAAMGWLPPLLEANE